MISKKELLSANVHGKPTIRPPYASKESHFDELCESCGDCLLACPEKILIYARGKLPKIDFSIGECTLCFKCVDACKYQALSRENKPAQYVALIIQEKCLSFNKVICDVCFDSCQYEAIDRKIMPAGIKHIMINHSKCLSCGACFHDCPNNAVAMIFNKNVATCL